MDKLDTSKKIKKALFLLGIGLLFSANAWGRNFYFSTSSGDDSRSITQAQSPSTPWKTISKLNSIFSSLLPGDSVLFKRGEVFYGSIFITKSGTTTQPIVIGAYGSGVKPVISGFTDLTSWTSLGNGIYESAATNFKPTLNMVTVNGKNTPMGRYPNTGYLSFETHSGNTAITDNQLTGTPNWTGAEVVIRKAKYTLGRNKITNHTGSTITYSGGGETPNDNFGYFIQNDPKTLDLTGEWYLNPVSKKLQVFFGASNPSSFNVKASSLDTLLNSNYQSYINITNLDFEGSNSYALYIRGGQNTTVSNCDIDFSGNNGVWAINNPNFRFEGNTVNHSNHSSIQVSCTNAVIRNNTIKNSAILQGMAYESNGYNGIELFGGDGTLVEYNEVDSVGAHGIFLRGNNVTIKNNLVNHFAYHLDDVGGIYTVGKFSGRKIIGNIVINGIGSIAGTLSTIAGIKGIMLEVYSAFIEIKDNTIANAGVSGIHLNSSHDLIIRNNTSFNNRYQILSQGSATDPAEYTRNLSIFRNIFFSLVSTQITLEMWSLRDDISLFGTADSNYYCRPIDDNSTISTGAAGIWVKRSLAGWQAYSGKDANSKKSPQTISSVNDVLFIYNASQSNKTVPLTAVYLDLDGKTITNSYTLLPYKSAILIKSADQTNGSNIAPVIKNQSFQINKNTTNGTLVGTIQSSDPNSGDILSYSIISGNTNSAFSLNSASGVLSVSNASAIAAQSANSYSLIVRVQDNGIGKLTTDATITINLLTSIAACSATGNITYQIWNKIGKPSSVASLTSNVNFPDNPTTSTLITSMEGLTNQADEYGSRIVGYICAPATGNYTFWIASDNNGELWLSTDDQPANKQLIAYHNGATLPRVWNSYATQKSAVIPLIQGQKYYIEALMVEAYGGDCLAVGWLKPGQTGTGPSEVIPGSVLSPLGSNSTIQVSSVSLPSTSSVNTGSTVMLLATVSPDNATNNSLTWTSSNTAIATVNSSGLITGMSTGTATITATSTDGSNKSASCQVTVNAVVCSATGNITYQIWNKIGRPSSVASLTSNVNFPNNPTTSTLITSMEGLTNQADEYGSRIVGYICAPATGNYTFWIASDNNGELWLSTDDQPANKQLIAYHNGATLPRVWNSYSTQKSAVISLVQGKKYYIEALMVEAYGGDCLAVGWLKPGQTGSAPSEVIPGAVLSPFISNLVIPVSSVSLPSTSSVNTGSTVMLLATVSPDNATNNSLTWTSSNTAIATVNSSGLVTGMSPGTATITATSTDGSNKSASCQVTVNAVVCSATGNITYQIWNKIGRPSSVASLTSNVNFPDNPTTSTLITSMEGLTNQADEYGSRIVGYICAPATGNYTFWIASDNNGELWLSTDDQPANKQLIAYHNGATLPRVWNSYATQKSAVIPLIQGQKYYIEALMVEAYGGDCLAVGWLKPGQTGSAPSEVIPGAVLSPLELKSKQADNTEIVTENEELKLSVYPNPLNAEILNIKLDNLASEATLKIFSISGVEFYTEKITSSGIIHINRTIFKRGVYIVQILDQNNTKSTKLVVN